MILLDTHVLIWAINNEPRLGARARERLDAEARDGTLYVSAITPWEIALLTHKGRLQLGRDPIEWIDSALAMPAITLAPLAPRIAVASVQLPGLAHGDPADRFIIATARHHGWSLLTADAAILAYGAAGHLAAIDARQ